MRRLPLNIRVSSILLYYVGAISVQLVSAQICTEALRCMRSLPEIQMRSGIPSHRQGAQWWPLPTDTCGHLESFGERLLQKSAEVRGSQSDKLERV